MSTSCSPAYESYSSLGSPPEPSLDAIDANTVDGSNDKAITSLEVEKSPPTDNSASARIDLQHPLQFYATMCVFSYIGALIRVGISYFRIWKVETSYTVMFANILGSFIIGYMRHCKVDALASNDLKQIIFLGITTGLCGSITSFSTWAMECNKSLFLQFDSSWGNSASSYNGGRFLEWLVSLWTGVAVPLSALQLGIYASSRYPINSFFNPKNQSTMGNATEYYIYGAVTFANVLLIAVPILASLAHGDNIMSWSYLFYTASTVSRYHLSLRNKASPTFPIGTFWANVSGTCILAVATVLSKFVVNYYDIDLQSLLFGLSFGFCGCQTTISTFVNEIYDLAPLDAYKYSIGTNAAAQLGIFLIYNIYSYTAIKPEFLMPKPIDQCFTYQKYCNILMHRIGCPSSLIENTACTDMHDYSTFVDICRCGTFSGTRVGELIVDSQVKFNTTNSFVAVWPTDATLMKEPTEVIDYCLTYKNMCDHYLNRIGCPADKRFVKACGRNGVTHAVQECTCATAIDVGSERIHELIVDTLLLRRYDLVPYNGYVTKNATNFCSAFRKLCNTMLDHLQCPSESRVVIGCIEDNDYDTYPIAGATCDCGRLALGHRIAEDLYDTIVIPSSQPLVQRVSYDVNVWDVCTSYLNICSLFLDKIGCPQNMRTITTCGGSNPTYPNGVVQDFRGVCYCGSLQECAERSVEAIIDSLLLEDMYNDILYIAPPQAPFTLLVASNPFRQLPSLPRPTQ